MSWHTRAYLKSREIHLHNFTLVDHCTHFNLNRAGPRPGPDPGPGPGTGTLARFTI